MILNFTLTMPNIGSWNNRWSGQNKLYAKVINTGRNKEQIKEARKIIDNQPYSYDFGDGWTASVSVQKVTSINAAIIRRKSDGFCGYDWMIESITEKGFIED